MWHPEGGLPHSVWSYIDISKIRGANSQNWISDWAFWTILSWGFLKGPMSRRICQVFALQHGGGTRIIATPPVGCSDQKEAPPGFGELPSLNGPIPVVDGFSDSNIRIQHWLFFLPPPSTSLIFQPPLIGLFGPVHASTS
jgi:hypothetical protein